MKRNKDHPNQSGDSRQGIQPSEVHNTFDPKLEAIWATIVEAISTYYKRQMVCDDDELLTMFHDHLEWFANNQLIDVDAALQTKYLKLIKGSVKKCMDDQNLTLTKEQIKDEYVKLL